ncbi:hypothetical protein CKAN_00499600 [Cinnamomum micranthum f. kanehirae]|uniref:Uncharacterized protein n=1 Tax=Cinnamomum micranthum f. kanehirae TaxID=337451 RepID=A0A3S3MMV5_9MAGN|nr:hypothetical protein CKAN_00499600 [Cinnamomum micranthum f. kanehirae]
MRNKSRSENCRIATHRYCLPSQLVHVVGKVVPSGSSSHWRRRRKGRDGPGAIFWLCPRTRSLKKGKRRPILGVPGLRSFRSGSTRNPDPEHPTLSPKFPSSCPKNLSYLSFLKSCTAHLLPLGQISSIAHSYPLLIIAHLGKPDSSGSKESSKKRIPLPLPNVPEENGDRAEKIETLQRLRRS